MLGAEECLPSILALFKAARQRLSEATLHFLWRFARFYDIYTQRTLPPVYMIAAVLLFEAKLLPRNGGSSHQHFRPTSFLAPFEWGN
jgi:hypothetical protein